MRIINFYDGDLVLATRYIREMHAEHVQAVRPARERVAKLDRQLVALEQRERQLIDKRTDLLNKLRAKYTEDAKKEAKRLTKDIRSKLANFIKRSAHVELHE